MQSPQPARVIRQLPIDHPDAVRMMDALSAELLRLTGSDGRGSFEWDDSQPGHLFLVAYDGDRPVGCGGIRPLGDGAGEVKRVYADQPRKGIGASILDALEAAAPGLGIGRLILSTRLANPGGVAFYDARGWQRIPGYGKYAGSAAHQCFAKVV
jgi:GNAT superfamily N-acetyltransferase